MFYLYYSCCNSKSTTYNMSFLSTLVQFLERFANHHPLATPSINALIHVKIIKRYRIKQRGDGNVIDSEHVCNAIGDHSPGGCIHAPVCPFKNSTFQPKE